MLNIFNIQHFSVGDGDGIRTTVFFKGCNLRCPWCHNPESLSAEPTRLCDIRRCTTETVGKTVPVEGVVREVLADRAYYEESGGGATFSGGEPLLQAEGAKKAAELLYKENISLFIDTAGCVPYGAFEELNPFVDVYLFDIKTANEKRFRETAGGDLSLVRENLRRLIAEKKRVRVRIPLIPGFNTDNDDTDSICRLLSGCGAQTVDLLPFHRMGRSKYEAMGISYAYADILPPSRSELDRVLAAYQRYFRVRIEE